MKTITLTVRATPDGDAWVAEAFRSGIVVDYHAADDGELPEPVEIPPVRLLRPRPDHGLVVGNRVRVVNEDNNYNVKRGQTGTVTIVDKPVKGSIHVRWDGESISRRVRASLLVKIGP